MWSSINTDWCHFNTPVFYSVHHSYHSEIYISKSSQILTNIEKVQGEVHDLRKDLDKKDKEVEKLEERIVQLEESNTKLENSVNNQEQYSRRSCIRIFGLQEKRGENTDVLATDVIRSKLGVTLDPIKDIDRSHRTGSPREPTSASSSGQPSDGASSHNQRPRPIIMKLTSYRKRREIIQNRKKLKGTGIVIVEDLTLKNQKLLTVTRSSSKVISAWSSDGRIIALIGASGGKNITKLITREEDLKKIWK